MVQAIDKVALRLEAAILQHQKAQDGVGQSITAKITDVTRTTAKEILAESQRTTKAVQDLKASLEESVNFK